MCKIKKQENKYYIKKVVSEECGSYAFLRQHSFPAGACSTISKLWFEEVDTCGSSKNLLLPERGKAQTVSLWIFFGHIFVCTGVLKNDLVVLDACKKLHLLGRQVPWAPETTKPGPGKSIPLPHRGCCQCSTIILPANLQFQMANYMGNLTGYLWFLPLRSYAH